MKHQWHCWTHQFHFSPMLTCLSNLGQKNRTPGWNSWKHVENLSTLHRLQIAERKSFKSWHWLFNTCDGWTLVLNSIQCHSAYHKNWTIICSFQRPLSRMLSWDTSTGAMIVLLFEPLTSLLDLELSAASWDMPTCTCAFLTDGCQINTRDDNYSPSKPWGLLKHCTDQCPWCECDESNSEAAQGINWTSQTPKKLCTVLP